MGVLVPLSAAPPAPDAPARLVVKMVVHGDQTTWGEGDPPYRVGERLALFLDRQRWSDGSYKLVAPDGRLRIGGGLLRPTIGGRVARQLNALTVEEARTAARLARRR